MNQTDIDYIRGLKGKLNDTAIRKEIRRVFRVKKSQGNDLFNELFNPQPEAEEGSVVPATGTGITMDFKGNSAVMESRNPDVKTLEDLLAICEVDLNVWRVERHVVNKWATARSNRQANIGFDKGVMTGSVHDDGGMLVQPLYQVKAWLVRKTLEVDVRAIFEDFVKKAAEKAPKITGFKFARTSVTPSAERMLEISIPDFHLSKLCWPDETRGAPWDIKLAPEAYKAAAYGLLGMAKSAKPTRILLPIGNDFFNSDNLLGRTTAGTDQATSEDSRWQKTFMTGCELLTEVIEAFASEYPVDVIVVPGNHDYERSLYLGAYVSAWFRNHPNVTVDNAPTQRKYITFGQSLIGFTHGNEEKHDKLPMLMANEAKQAWAVTKFRFYKLGHFHHEIVKELGGVKVCVIPSLVPSDDWHTKKGLTGNIRSAQASLYDYTNGLVATYYHNAT